MKFEEWSTINFPTVLRTSWYDMFQKGGMRIANNYYAKSRCIGQLFRCTNTLLVDALGHAGLYGIPKENGSFPYNETAQNLITGYEQALAAVLLFTYQGATSNFITAGLNVFYDTVMRFIPDKIVYVMGSGGNYMTAFDRWPKVSEQAIWLEENGFMSFKTPTSASNVSYVYDPSDPAPSYGGWIFQNTNPLGSACVDQAPLAKRKDVIHFNSAPLDADLAICGEITASITVGSSANDTDFIVRLVDQYPSGERYNVAEGIVRMRWRDNVLTPIPMEQDHTYAVDIDMWSACWIFAAGHRVGVDITSSSGFVYLPNPNTGLPLETDGIWPQGGEVYKGENITATNAVYLGSSYLSLPVVKKADLPVIDPLLIPTPSAPPHTSELIQMGKEAIQKYNQE